MPTSMESKAEQLNKLIIDKAFEIFSKKGYSATLDEIRYSLDIGKGTLYNHFGNKESLFYSVVNEKLVALEFALTSAVNDHTDFMLHFQKTTEIALKFFLENLAIWEILHYQLSNQYHTQDRYKINQEKREQLLSRFDCIPQALEQLIADGQATSQFKDLSPHKAGIAYLSMIITTAHLEQGKKINLHDSAATIVDLFINGLAL